MRPESFSGLTFIRNAQSRIFKSRGYIMNVEELYDKKVPQK